MTNCGPTMSLSEAVAVLPAESLTETEKVEVPAVVGVPLMTPVAAARVRPAGRVPAEMVQVSPLPDPPEAASVAL